MAFNCPIITIEEHWCSPSVRAFYEAQGKPDPNSEHGPVGSVTPTLMEFGSKRLQAMDEGGVTLQVVSHSVNSIALDLETCVKTNDELADHVKSYPGRFAGFATLPMAYPDAAAEELRRCVQDLSFVGALIDSNCEGKFYDDSYYWPVFEMAEQLDVPIYLHPAPNEDTKSLLYDGNYPDLISVALSQFGWGWHSETAIHFLRLFSAGLFDRYPKLQLVLGHMGEMLPFQLDRIEHISTRGFPLAGVKLERQLRKVWNENLWVTTSGMPYMAPLAAVLKQCKPERIIYSVDYPFGQTSTGLKFLEQLRDEQIVSETVLQGIAFRNAEKLLKIKASLD